MRVQNSTADPMIPVNYLITCGILPLVYEQPYFTCSSSFKPLTSTDCLRAGIK